jgi:hypothetical protein
MDTRRANLARQEGELAESCSPPELAHHPRPLVALDDHAQTSSPHEVETVAGLAGSDDDLAGVDVHGPELSD